jgi:hypothetical protein
MIVSLYLSGSVYSMRIIWFFLLLPRKTVKIFLKERFKMRRLELKPGVQESIGGRHVKIWRVIWRFYVCYSAVVLGVCDSIPVVYIRED